MTKRFLLIANPIAGGGRARLAAPRLADALAALGCEAELHFTARQGDGAARAGRIRAGQFHGVIAIGGDGTLNEVLGGLPDPGAIALGILPVGTANVLALELGLPRAPEAFAEILAAGHTREISLGRARAPTPIPGTPETAGSADGRRFLLFVSSGMDARIVERVHEVRTGRQGFWRYILPVLHVIRRWRIEKLSVTVQGPLTGTERPDEEHDGFSTVVVTRARSYAGIVKFPGPIDLSDGLLHVLALRQRSRWSYFRVFIRAWLGRLRPDRDISCYSGTRVTIRCADAPWQIDGDLGGHGPVILELDDQPVRVFCSAPA